ncbi:flavoprotein-like protein [Blastocladiella britannica]|nr:flavoprotein-like protein [Blastocladiella britannica]
MPKPRVALITYSVYGHISIMAEAVKKGIEASGLATATIFQVQETLPEDLLKRLHAAPKPAYPIATPATLAEHDGVMFGVPSRFGMVPSQIKAYMDSTGAMWAKGELSGKPGAIFTSTANQSGGSESLGMGTMPFFVHHGMVFVPLGGAAPQLNGVDQVVGGSAWGASTVATGTGARQPSEDEKAVASIQGKVFAKIVAKLAAETKVE